MTVPMTTDDIPLYIQRLLNIQNNDIISLEIKLDEVLIFMDPSYNSQKNNPNLLSMRFIDSMIILNPHDYERRLILGPLFDNILDYEDESSFLKINRWDKARIDLSERKVIISNDQSFYRYEIYNIDNSKLTKVIKINKTGHQRIFNASESQFVLDYLESIIRLNVHKLIGIDCKNPIRYRYNKINELVEIICKILGTHNQIIKNGAEKTLSKNQKEFLYLKMLKKADKFDDNQTTNNYETDMIKEISYDNKEQMKSIYGIDEKNLIERIVKKTAVLSNMDKQFFLSNKDVIKEIIKREVKYYTNKVSHLYPYVLNDCNEMKSFYVENEDENIYI